MSGIRWSGFGPAGNLAKFGADLGQILRHYDGQADDALTNAIGHAGLAAANMVADEVGFQSIRNIIDVWEGNQTISRFASHQAASFIPFSSALGQTGSIIDPDMREARTILDGLRYQIPFLRETLPPKRDGLYGEPVPNPGYHTAFRAAPINQDPVRIELDKLGYFPQAPQRHIGGVQLTSEQYDRYQATAGPLVHQALSALVSQPGWSEKPPAARKKEMQAVISHARHQAATAIQMDQDELVRQGLDRRMKQITGRP